MDSRLRVSTKALETSVNTWLVGANKATTPPLSCLCVSSCSRINPITGHVEEPMPNPMEEMTEEQKEYEAQKIVIMLDELIR